jgi:hypothetical protein
MFLEVITRTFGQRPLLLQRCRRSLELLHSSDWEQRIVVDEQGRGVAWANRNLATVETTGDWVWVLDDDNIASHRDLIGELKALIRRKKPEIVIARCYHRKYGMLPPYDLWEQRPVRDRYDGACLFARGDIWNKYRDGWVADYAGDWHFVNHLWEAGVKAAWLPVAAAYLPEALYGRPEQVAGGEKRVYFNYEPGELTPRSE